MNFLDEYGINCEDAFKLAERGASPLLDMGIGDDQDEDKFETGFEQWLPAWLDEVQGRRTTRTTTRPSPSSGWTPWAPRTGSRP